MAAALCLALGGSSRGQRDTHCKHRKRGLGTLLPRTWAEDGVASRPSELHADRSSSPIVSQLQAFKNLSPLPLSLPPPLTALLSSPNLTSENLSSSSFVPFSPYFPLFLFCHLEALTTQLANRSQHGYQSRYQLLRSYRPHRSAQCPRKPGC